MRYTLQEQPDGSHLKYRHAELSEYNGGRPTNAEVEFWLEIEALRDKLVEMGEHAEAMKEGFAVRIAGLELLERQVDHGCMDVSCAICNAGAKK